LYTRPSKVSKGARDANRRSMSEMSRSAGRLRWVNVYK
jgi:hypothetical protein